MRRLLAPLVLLVVAVPLWAEEPREVLARAVRAHGGADNLARSQAGGMSFRAKLPGNGLQGEMTGDWVVQQPDRQKISMKLDLPEVGKIDYVMAVADGKGWLRMSQNGQQQ